MFKWIDLLFNKAKKKDEEEILKFQKMTKGDLKKLQAEGKIKTIYPPYY
jgi:hypothetical protein